MKDPRHRAAIAALKATKEYDPQDAETCIVDLIANLLHFANDRGLDVTRILYQGREHFESEVLEEAHAENLMEERTTV